MKKVCQDLAGAFRTLFGYGIMIALFAGGLTVIGYVVALFIGGATVNGAVEKSASTVYNYDKTTQSIVTTVDGDQHWFGLAEGTEPTSLQVLTSTEKASLIRLYTLNKQGEPKVSETLKAKQTYLLGVQVDKKVYFLSEGMNLSDDVAAAKVWTASQDGDKTGYRFSYQEMVVNEETGKEEPKLDKNNKEVFQYVNMIYSGGKGEEIATFIANEITPNITYLSTIMVLLGLLTMYLSGEQALTVSKKESAKHEGEM